MGAAGTEVRDSTMMADALLNFILLFNLRTTRDWNGPNLHYKVHFTKSGRKEGEEEEDRGVEATADAAWEVELEEGVSGKTFKMDDFLPI